MRGAAAEPMAIGGNSAMLARCGGVPCLILRLVHAGLVLFFDLGVRDFSPCACLLCISTVGMPASICMWVLVSRAKRCREPPKESTQDLGERGVSIVGGLVVEGAPPKARKLA